MTAVIITLSLLSSMNISVLWSNLGMTYEAWGSLENEEKAYLEFVTTKVKESNVNAGNSTTATTQIPETAKGPTIPSKGYLVQELGNSLYSVSDGSYNTIFLVTDKGVVVIDAPPSLGQKYLQAVADVTDKPINYVIYSHAHLDHIGAAGLFPKNATIIAQEETTAELQKARSVAENVSDVPPIPTISFSKNYTLQIGNQSLKLDYHGNNHLPGNLFIYAPNQKVLMLVDIIFPGWIPFPYLAIAKDVAGFIQAHDLALNDYDFDTFVGGHLTRLGTRNDVTIQKEFISDLREAAQKANNEVLFSNIAQEVGRFDNPWLLFSKYIDAINENCAQTMLPKWENRLGGAREFMSTHCFTMTEAGRVEPTVHMLLQNSTVTSK